MDAVGHGHDITKKVRPQAQAFEDFGDTRSSRVGGEEFGISGCDIPGRFRLFHPADSGHVLDLIDVLVADRLYNAVRRTGLQSKMGETRLAGSIMLSVVLLVLGLADNSAADVVTLRDGKVILCQIVDPAPRGKFVVVVRRIWAEKNLPDRLRAWKSAEAPSLKRAVADRIHRLEAWKRERNAEPNDLILGWIQTELTRLRADADAPKLIAVTLNRGDIRKIDKKPPDAARKLRQAWRAGFEDAETKPLDDLSSALEGRGFAMSNVDPAPIADLLPISSETEGQWQARRAATEVAQDSKLRFISHLGILLPEGTPAAGIDLGGISGLVKGLLGEGAAEDPLIAKGRELSAKGHVGMMVTTLETAEDMSGVKVEVVLYARMKDDRWERAAVKSVRVRTDEIKAGEGANIAADPQVSSIFKAVEGLGLDLPADLKEKSLKIGAATQKALGSARTAIQLDLDSLNLIK